MSWQEERAQRLAEQELKFNALIEHHPDDPKTLELITDYLQGQLYAEWCSKYGEPGHEQPERGVILCNWNDVPESIQDYLEARGYELEWSDEWTIDYDNDKAYRTQPDGHGWEPSVVYVGDGAAMFTRDDDPSEIIEAFAADDNPRALLPAWIDESDLEQAEFEKFGDKYENGLREGSNDDPIEIAKRAREAGAESVLFRRVDVNGDAYTVFFECWIRHASED